MNCSIILHLDDLYENADPANNRMPAQKPIRKVRALDNPKYKKTREERLYDHRIRQATFKSKNNRNIPIVCPDCGAKYKPLGDYYVRKHTNTKRHMKALLQ